MSRQNINQYIVLETQNPVVINDGDILFEALRGPREDVIKHPIKYLECLYKGNWLDCVSNYTFCASGFYFFELAFKCDITENVIVSGYAGTERDGKISTRDYIYEICKADGKGIIRFHFPIQKEDVANLDNINIYFHFPDNAIETDIYRKIEANLLSIKRYISELRGVDDLIFRMPSLDGEYVITPLDCSYSQSFFAKLYLYQEYTVLSQVISHSGLLQYQIPIEASDEELLLLISGDHYLKKTVWYEQEVIGNNLLLSGDNSWNRHSKILCLLDETNELLQSKNMIRVRLCHEQYKECVKKLNNWIKENLNIAYKRYIKNFGNVKWKSEYRLFQFIKIFFPDAIYQYRSEWLGEQSLDIFIPSISSCIEYHGEQHFTSSAYFGGDPGLEKQKERDYRKEEKCNENGVKYVVWAYNLSVTYEHVRDFVFINFHGLVKTDEWTISEHLSEGVPFKLSEILLLESNLPYSEREINKERVNYISQDVIRQYDFNGIYVAEYESISDASKKNQIGASSIHKCISGQRLRAGEYYWRREPRESQPQGIILVQKQISNQSNWTNQNIIVNQISISTGEILNTYESINAAAKAVGIDRKGIKDVLLGNQRSAGGFFWAKENNFTTL